MTAERVSRAGHLVMVLAMVWRGEVVAGWLQSGLFTAFAFWFALRVVAVRSCRVVQAHHATLAAAMAWMTAVPGHHGHGIGRAAALVAGYAAAASLVWLAVALRFARPAALAHAAMAAAMAMMSAGFWPGR